MSNLSLIQLALYVVAPLAVALLAKASLSRPLKSLLLLAVTAAVTVLTARGESGVWDEALIRTQLEGFLVAVGSYFGVWRALGMTPERVFPTFGLGRTAEPVDLDPLPFEGNPFDGPSAATS